ncbi:MAG: Fe-Mn family superoxide dismutase [Clostridia bacterium]|nr:Fe-Mn family superoxide dismutase [Clostridia bacterium]
MDEKYILSITEQKAGRNGIFEALPFPFSTGEAAFPDRESAELHHGGHYAGAAAALNERLSCYPAYACCSLRALVMGADRMPAAIRRDVKNLAGSMICHGIWFAATAPGASPLRNPELMGEILRGYGSMEKFRLIFTRCAEELVGSGWVWLLRDRFGRLSIQPTHNNELPNLAVYTPILNLDCFEHAYYMRWKNRRDRYTAAWFRWME